MWRHEKVEYDVLGKRSRLFESFLNVALPRMRDDSFPLKSPVSDFLFCLITYEDVTVPGNENSVIVTCGLVFLREFWGGVAISYMSAICLIMGLSLVLSITVSNTQSKAHNGLYNQKKCCWMSEMYNHDLSGVF